VNTDCGFNSLHVRVMPSHAIELASVYLDRNVAAALARAPDMTASSQQHQDARCRIDHLVIDLQLVRRRRTAVVPAAFRRYRMLLRPGQ
jgi:hypothetical protein